MTKPKVGFIYAHPDDETFGCACLIRELADQDSEPVLLCATRGDAGKTGRLGEMTREELAVLREQELRAAGDIMGLTVIQHLGYPDGKLKDVPREELVEHIVHFIHTYQLAVVVTFPEDGISGHLDHVAIHHATNEAIFSGRCPSVQKLYYNAPFAMRGTADGVTLQISVEPHWPMKAEALRAHQSQIFSIERVFGNLEQIPENELKRGEPFVLAWERGAHWPKKHEATIYDDLI
ncbi:PIG-L family deacetylase [Paenibacillus terrigena]|uniref:PIG-L deacetylase family protein n=1 Tax=Paenibacillus terrigena TaxID=369333 RepID=UPI0028D54DFD|nr:PIG-L family deacetylase [Paenibacillus terrigena]